MTGSQPRVWLPRHLQRCNQGYWWYFLGGIVCATERKCLRVESFSHAELNRLWPNSLLQECRRDGKTMFLPSERLGLPHGKIGYTALLYSRDRSFTATNHMMPSLSAVWDWLETPHIEELTKNHDAFVEYLWIALTAAAAVACDTRFVAVSSWLRLWPLLLEFLPVYISEQQSNTPATVVSGYQRYLATMVLS